MSDMRDMDPIEIKEEQVPPIAELRDFELTPDAEFADGVRRRIGNREVASGVVYLSTHGFFKLLVGYLSIALEAIKPPPGPDTGHKE